MHLFLPFLSLLALTAAQSGPSGPPGSSSTSEGNLNSTQALTNNTLTCFARGAVTANNSMTTFDANSAIEKFCKDAKGTFSLSMPVLIQAIAFLIPDPNKSETSTEIGVSAVWRPTPNTKCPDFTFNTTNLDVCEDRLGYILNNCDTVKKNPQPYWKQGGSYLDDCILWTLAPRTHYNSTNYSSMASHGAGNIGGALALVAALAIAFLTL